MKSAPKAAPTVSRGECPQLDLDAKVATRLSSKNCETLGEATGDRPDDFGRPATGHVTRKQAEEMEHLRQQLTFTRRAEAEALSELQSLREQKHGEALEALCVSSEPISPAKSLLLSTLVPAVELEEPVSTPSAPVLAQQLSQSSLSQTSSPTSSPQKAKSAPARGPPDNSARRASLRADRKEATPSTPNNATPARGPPDASVRRSSKNVEAETDASARRSSKHAGAETTEASARRTSIRAEETPTSPSKTASARGPPDNSARRASLRAEAEAATKIMKGAPTTPKALGNHAAATGVTAKGIANEKATTVLLSSSLRS